MPTPDLRPMSDFDSSKPAMVHDQLNDASWNGSGFFAIGGGFTPSLTARLRHRRPPGITAEAEGEQGAAPHQAVGDLGVAAVRAIETLAPDCCQNRLRLIAGRAKSVGCTGGMDWFHGRVLS